MLIDAAIWEMSRVFSLLIFASSAESVGDFWLWQIA
jgi:hypothetical protein